MTRAIISLVAFVCVAAALHGQMLQLNVVNGPNCGSSGTTFTETWGDGGDYNGSIACPDGTAGCANRWVRGGSQTSDSIVALGSGWPAGSACTRGLQMVQDGTHGAGYIQNSGWAPGFPAGTVITGSFTARLVSDSLGSGSNQTVYRFQGGSSGSSTVADFKIKNNSGTRGVVATNGSSSPFSAQLNIVAGTPFTVWFQLKNDDSSTSSCSGVVCNSAFSLASAADVQTCAGTVADTSTCVRFRTSNSSINNFIKGVNSGTPVALSIQWGSDTISTNQGNTKGASMALSELSGNDGDATSTTVLSNATLAGNGTWTQGGNSVAGFTIKSPCPYTPTLGSGQIVAGTSQTLSGTRCTKWLLSSASSGDYRYRAIANSSAASVFFEWYTDQPANSQVYASFGSLNSSDSVDFASAMYNNGQLYLETADNPNGNPDTGSKLSVSTSTPYKVGIQFVRNGAHTMWVWDAGCNLLSTQTKAAHPGVTTYPTDFYYGRLGDAGGTPTGSIYLGRVYMDYKTGAPPQCH
ncbi:MAG TPA: hypothetical protein VMS96_08565 [Terriglobales bacterium]|nr:hypothetical protein [Terriglobales bacterium]